MPIPEERLPDVDETIDTPSSEIEAAGPELLAEEDELELESAEAEEYTDETSDNEEAAERDTASFGFGDPAD